MYTRVKHGWSKHFDFMLMDLLCIYLSFYISYLLRHGFINPFRSVVYKDLFLVMSLLHIIIVFFLEPYNGILRRGKARELEKVFVYSVFLMGAVFVYIFFSRHSEAYSRVVLLIFGILSFLLVYLSRLVLKRYICLFKGFNRNVKYMLLYGSKESLSVMIERVSGALYDNVVIAGLVVSDCDMEGKCIHNILVVANKDNLFDFLRKHVVDRVVIDAKEKQAIELADKMVHMGITVHISLEQISSFGLPNCSVEYVNGMNVITTSISVATDRQAFLKRAMDIVGSLFGLVLCAIAFLFVAPIIKIQSPGPVFFSQIRVGKNGRKFRIYKFRTMCMGAESQKQELMELNDMSGLMFKMKEDPRIFPAGHSMRALSIDELPQFWNVLRGDMSLVGTRPPTIDEYEQYDFEYKSRLAAKPGITGMWQVSGRSDITDFEKVLELDKEYIENWRLSLDIKILLKTLQVVIKRSGSR